MNLKTKECAAVLNLHPATVIRMCREGEIRSFKIGKHYRIPLNQFRGKIDSELYAALVSAWRDQYEKSRD